MKTGRSIEHKNAELLRRAGRQKQKEEYEELQLKEEEFNSAAWMTMARPQNSYTGFMMMVLAL